LSEPAPKMTSGIHACCRLVTQTVLSGGQQRSLPVLHARRNLGKNDIILSRIWANSLTIELTLCAKTSASMRNASVSPEPIRAGTDKARYRSCSRSCKNQGQKELLQSLAFVRCQVFVLDAHAIISDRAYHSYR
jgi:hypothetical protein